jgi:hypothetical protein
VMKIVYVSIFYNRLFKSARRKSRQLSPTARPVPGGPLSMSRAVRETLASAVRVRFLAAHPNSKRERLLLLCNRRRVRPSLLHPKPLTYNYLIIII